MNVKLAEECIKLNNERIEESKNIINLLEKGKINQFGLPDPLDGFGAYFPCEFIETIDYDKGLIKIYEPSIKTYHITEAWGLIIIDNINLKEEISNE